MKMLNPANKILEVLVRPINEKEIPLVLLEILFVFGRNKDCTLKDLLLCSDLPYPLVTFDKPQALPAKSSTCQPTYTLSSITIVT